jgi:corrinoid protein of di/trimethylamine methyltransferase
MVVKTEILTHLSQAIIEYDDKDAASWARKAIEEGISPGEALDVLIDTIRQIGDGYARGELFLPDLIMAGEAMKSGAAVLEAEIKKKAGVRSPKIKTLVIGTVTGDMHDIGKSLVATMFMGAGYRVIDLGVDVPTMRFVEAVQEHEPDLLGLSALLSTTALEQGKIIEALTESGLRDKVKVIVGGGAVTREFADRIGADGHADNAPEAVAVGDRLCER